MWSSSPHTWKYFLQLQDSLWDFHGIFCQISYERFFTKSVHNGTCGCVNNLFKKSHIIYCPKVIGKCSLFYFYGCQSDTKFTEVIPWDHLFSVMLPGHIIMRKVNFWYRNMKNKDTKRIQNKWIDRFIMVLHAV